MKIRKGFVTNSSSSSFILGFKKDESIYHEIEASFPSYIKSSCIGQIVDDIDNNMVTLEQAAEEYAHYHGDYYNKNDKFYKFYNKFIEENKKYDRFSIIEVSDNDGEFWSLVEHELLPDCSFTLARLSHH